MVTWQGPAIGWQDTYVFTKSMGEMMLSRYLKKSKFAAAVVRPSIVESSTEEPLRGWIEGLRSVGPPPHSWLSDQPHFTHAHLTRCPKQSSGSVANPFWWAHKG